jgi:hypothetical protein
MLDLLYIMEMKLEVLNVLGLEMAGELHEKEGQKNEKLSVYIIMIFVLMISLS